MYEIIFSDNSKKQFQKLEKDVQSRIIKVLERSRIRPEHYFIRLVGDPGYKLRIGDYRVIADINGTILQILVIKVGHRRDVYDK
ncbi:cytotoxic translational repressor of toxin-antitoxin stability system [Candidatus Woesearchaeota archaeon CG10_big_fil_rev_8_21_14_0_10_37_12]|nr:MAG: cytotoxic translational repressor of toxin-antitoxin stability system [Candidatus Woesearchaeota archaeon CG10_big_fil_rev_8_21_14_0_10_37_12]